MSHRSCLPVHLPVALPLLAGLIVLAAGLVRPAPAEAALADLSAVVWERMTPIESNFDGVQAMAIGADGTIFIHDNIGRIRRSGDEGRTWNTLLEGIKCCGSIAIRRAGQIFVAAPSGLLYSSDNGATWTNWDEENTYNVVVIAPSTNHVLAATPRVLKRYDLQGNLVDEADIEAIQDMEVCGNGRRTALVVRDGNLYINDQAALPADGWAEPPDVVVPLNSSTSVNLDSDCNVFQGYRNGYRTYGFPNGPMTPSARFPPKDLFYPAGYPTGAGSVYQGTGDINDILAFSNGPALVAGSRGAYCVPDGSNGAVADECNDGTDRSEVFQEVAIHPVNGHVYAAISSTAISKRFCFRIVNGQAQPYTCGYVYDFSGGLFRTNQPVLQNRVVGDDFGAEFQRENFDGVGFDEEVGGLVVRSDPDEQTYLWVVNTDLSTVSRFTPGTPPRELSEYRVGLPQGLCQGSCCHTNGCNMASRVALDSLGNAYVGNRGFGMQGTVTKIARNEEDCVDRNGNGVIDTSRNGRPLNWGQDECVLWTANAGPHNALIRALTIDLGDEQNPDGYPWAGGYNTRQWYKMHPRTGQQLATVNVPVNPYGGVVTADGKLWIGTLGNDGTSWIDTHNNRAGPFIAYPNDVRQTGCGSSYGIAADTGGRLWFSGWGCGDAMAHDPSDGSWSKVDIDQWGRTAGRGITIDQNGWMWMAMSSGNASYVVWWHSTEYRRNSQIPENIVGSRRIPDGNTGPAAIGADNQGIIWMTFYGQNPSNIARINPGNNASVDIYPGSGRVYSYTDFTGEVRRLAIGRGSYEEIFDAGCNQPVWNSLTWDADIPGGGTIRFDATSAADLGDFENQTFRGLATTPPANGPVHVSNRLVASGVASRRFLKMKVTLQLNEDAESPLLRQFQVRWSCP